MVKALYDKLDMVLLLDVSVQRDALAVARVALTERQDCFLTSRISAIRKQGEDLMQLLAIDVAVLPVETEVVVHIVRIALMFAYAGDDGRLSF